MHKYNFLSKELNKLNFPLRLKDNFYYIITRLYLKNNEFKKQTIIINITMDL